MFTAGRLAIYLPKWREITTDQIILQYVQGVKIEFIEGKPPSQSGFRPSVFNTHEHTIVEKELHKLLDKGVIKASCHEPGEYISTIFLRPKNDGSYRVILNLKQFNTFVEYHHFKMDTLDAVLKMIKPGCFMASVDLRDAYYTVPVWAEHQKLLKFMFNGTLYQYTCLPNGLSSAPRIFTKLLKPVYARLHEQGYPNLGYIDDSYLQGDNPVDCTKNVKATVSLFSELGFYLHEEKSVLQPTQQLIFLGFQLDSCKMTVSPTPKKVTKTVHACTQLKNKPVPLVSDVAEVIGILVSNFPGVEFGPLHYRALERDKTLALKCHRGDYTSAMQLSTDSLKELDWWVDNMAHSKSDIVHPNPSIILQSDASKLGWGAVRKDETIGGRWTSTEATAHINVLELQAAFFALKSFAVDENNMHVQLQIDNTTAVSYVNNMGGTQSSQLNALALELWEWAIERSIWLSAVHIPGKENTGADRESRNFSDRHEWSLDKAVFRNIHALYPNLDIDLFATRLNHQLDLYCSWKPDPGAHYVDAFAIDWSKFSFYAFPPFSLVPRCVQKISQDKAKGILVVPLWPTQPWFALLLQMLYDSPRVLPPGPKLLQHPNWDHPHPLHKKLHLMVCPLSGIPSDNLTFLQTQQNFSWPHGEQGPRNSTRRILNSGWTFVVRGISITVNQL